MVIGKVGCGLWKYFKTASMFLSEDLWQSIV